MGLNRFPLNDFRGGWNTRDSPVELQANESPDELNMTLSPLVGTLEQRKGKVRWDTAGMPAQAADHMRRWIFGSTSLLLLSINGDVYSANAAGQLTRRFDSVGSAVWCFESTQDINNVDRMWMVNGVDVPQKWDGVAGTTSAWTNPPPLACTMLREWRNIMVASGDPSRPQRLYYSAAADPEALPTWNFIDIRYSDDDLDAVQWLDVYGDELIVFKKNSVSAVYDPVSFTNRRVGKPGCEGRFQSAEVENKIYFFHRSGLWSLGPGNQVEEESESIQNYFPAHVNMSALAKARVSGTPLNRVLLSIPVDSSATNNLVIELVPHINFRRLGGRRYVLLPALLRHDWHVSALCLGRPSFTDIVLSGDAAGGKLHQLFSGTNDDGAAISAYWFTAWRGIQELEPKERLRRVNCEYTGTVVIDVFNDLDSNVVKFSEQLVPILSVDPLWDGGGIWDDGGLWEAFSATRIGRVRPETFARYHQIRFRNSQLDQTFLIYNAELVYRGGKEH